MKERITITVEDELLDWVDRKVADRTFANRSHALTKLAREMMEQHGQGRDKS